MKKIAIVRCLEVSYRCTGSGCLKAFHNRAKAFGCYGDEEVYLASFFSCNGCDRDPEEDEEMIKKLDRLQKMGVDTVHTSSCTQKAGQGYCVNMEKIVNMLRDRGIKTIHGTHKETA